MDYSSLNLIYCLLDVLHKKSETYSVEYIHHTDESILRLYPSIPSGCWPPALLRCLHENIHETKYNHANAGPFETFRSFRKAAFYLFHPAKRFLSVDERFPK